MADILLVDDEKSVRTTLALMLKRVGYQVEEAVNGKSALEKIKNQFFDLVITDLKMEPVGGMEVLRQVAKKEKLLEKIQTRPIRKDITYSEVESLFKSLGYKVLEGEGSRVKFYNPNTDDLIILHKPHPGKELKVYAVKNIQIKLKQLKSK